MNNVSAKSNRKKLIIALPLFFLPLGIIIYLVSTLFGGKGNDHAKPTSVNAFNSKLPSAKIELTEKNKLQLYLEAERDSVKRNEQIANDPNIRKLYDPGAIDQNAFSPSPPVPGGSQSVQTAPSFKTDQNERKVDDRLKKLYSILNQQSPAGTAPESAQSGGIPGASENTTQRLESILSNIPKPDTSINDQLRQANQLLDKYYAIQHPEKKTKSYSIADSPAEKVYTVLPADQLQDLPNSTLSNSSVDPSMAGNSFFPISQEEDSSSKYSIPQSIQAVVHETQVVESGSTVTLRLLQDVIIAGNKIPHGSFIYGDCNIGNQRVEISLTTVIWNNQVLPISLKVYDGTDGLAGIRIQGQGSVDVAKNGMTQGMQSIGMTSLDQSVAAQATAASIETAKTLLSRKVKTVKITLKAGHHVLLRA
jgi:conjugative transposon TraM protein